MSDPCDSRALLCRLGSEIRATHGLARQVEDAVAELAILPQHLRLPAELQHIDQIVQRLAGLAAFCAALAEQGGAQNLGAALAVVHLQSLAEGLGGHAPGAAPHCGEVEVF